MSEQTIHLQLFKLILRRMSFLNIKQWCFNRKKGMYPSVLTVKAAISFHVCEERECYETGFANDVGRLRNPCIRRGGEQQSQR